MTHNQYPETVRLLGHEIERVRLNLCAGWLPSEIANSLHAAGFSSIQLLVIFREATGASLKDIKALGQWWGRHGVTDPASFDSWAVEIFQRQGKIA